MATTQRKRHSAGFKAKVALEATKEIKTLNQLTSQYGVHQTQISQWKKTLLEGLPELFGTKNETRSKEDKKLIDDLYRQVGEVTFQRDWLKKKLESCR